MSVQLPQPLPECSSCGRPTSRVAYRRLNGRCTACAAWQDAATAVGADAADAELEQLRDWQATVRRIRRDEALATAERARRRRLRARQRRA